MDGTRNKILVLAGQSKANGDALAALKAQCEVVEVSSVDEAVAVLRRDHRFTGIFSDSADFLPLEREIVSQQSNMILNTIGEGVCIVDGQGRCSWMNRKMQAWPPLVHQEIRRKCLEAFDLFTRQVSPAPPVPSPPTLQAPDAAAAFNRSKRYALNIEDSQFMEMIASPVIAPTGAVAQVVAVVWDATGVRRMQQKIDAIDKAGRELVRLEADTMSRMTVAQRLKLLEEKIISFTRELMHFDHFAIRLLDRHNKKLEVVIAQGLPAEALDVELYAEPEGNGISGYVAGTGRSYICPDVERDPRYVRGLDQAKSSLTVPLSLHDQVIGIFNVESHQRGAFNEDDRQFAEIFARYVAIALNILDLMVVERAGTAHKVAGDACAEAAGPLNDIASDANALLEMGEFVGHDAARAKLRQIVDNVKLIQDSLHQVARGPCTITDASDVEEDENDPVLSGARVLVADDNANIRTTIADVFRKFHMDVTVAENGADAIAHIERGGCEFDLLLSDIHMPDKTGYAVFAAARKHRATIPVILMTGFGYDPHHSIIRASPEGLQAVLYKPFKAAQLLEEVRKALQTRAPAQPPPQPVC